MSSGGGIGGGMGPTASSPASVEGGGIGAPPQPVTPTVTASTAAEVAKRGARGFGVKEGTDEDPIGSVRVWPQRATPRHTRVWTRNRVASGA
ncbi:MAG: hypothetical protein OHK0013_44230 [Sandaracinaceae bacterium]